ncbi:MAG: hypothetical protein Q7K43_06020 [Candidatus Woesearchaeota archaeon]|nr:hypothetical protein [Candidatus Woesearchaeota archaeon]
MTKNFAEELIVAKSLWDGIQAETNSLKSLFGTNAKRAEEIARTLVLTHTMFQRVLRNAPLNSKIREVALALLSNVEPKLLFIPPKLRDSLMRSVSLKS